MRTGFNSSKNFKFIFVLQIKYFFMQRINIQYRYVPKTETECECLDKDKDYHWAAVKKLTAKAPETVFINEYVDKACLFTRYYIISYLFKVTPKLVILQFVVCVLKQCFIIWKWPPIIRKQISDVHSVQRLNRTNSGPDRGLRFRQKYNAGSFGAKASTDRAWWRLQFESFRQKTTIQSIFYVTYDLNEHKQLSSQ